MSSLEKWKAKRPVSTPQAEATSSCLQRRFRCRKLSAEGRHLNTDDVTNWMPRVARRQRTFTWLLFLVMKKMVIRLEDA